MTIPRIGGIVRPVAPKEVSGAEDESGEESPNALNSESGRSDSVQLSEQGLARAAENDVAVERETEIRTRIEASFYDDPSVALEVAQRLFDSEDFFTDLSTGIQQPS